MSGDSTMATSRPNGIANDVPSTPPDANNPAHSSSQQSLPSTEGPQSPIDPSASFKTELNDDRLPPSQVIPSSLTPPPSSQVPQTNGASALGYVNSQRAAMFSPPATTLNNIRRDGAGPSEFTAPSARQIADAPAEELRQMLHDSLAENARLKMETAHHKLQYNLLSLQADEEVKRAAVEHEMMRREVEALRMAEHSRQARRDLSAAAESAHAKYLQLKAVYEAAVDDNEALRKRAKLARKVIQQKEEDIISLSDERDMLLNRIRENREHFHMLCSPGGAFYGALTPKTTAATSPQQHRATPRQANKSAHARHGADHEQAPFAALLQALSHDNNSAPSTPTSATRPAPRLPPKHTRGVQSLSSLPTTPISRTRGEHSGLLPSVDLVPQTEPVQRYSSHRQFPATPTPKRNRKSRESTISVDDNEALARAALESVAAATQSYMSQGSRESRHNHDDEEDEEVFQSQASQAASEMLRRDPRESFEVASSVGSRDGTPAPAEKTAKLQAKLYAGVNKSSVAAEKRKFSGTPVATEGARRDVQSSPAKKMRFGGSAAGEGHQRVGLGIQYGRES